MKKNDDCFQHRRHNKNLLMVHLIFVTKYRKKLLYGDLKEDIKKWIFDTSVKNRWYVKRMETDRDHIHILLQYNPADSVRKIVAKLKQCSTFYAWKKYDVIFSRCYWKEHTLWSDGYFAASVGQVSQKTIEHYIETQG